jgi:hypothetical protein
MNFKCKPMFNINIFYFLIIYVTIDFNGNHLKNYGWIIKKKNEFIMDYWNDDIVFVTQKIKNVDSENKSSSNEELKTNMHWNFLNTKNCHFEKKLIHDFCHFVSFLFSFHIENLKISHECFGQSHV